MPIPAGSETSLISVTDLPASIQGAELVDLMVAGANAKAARVAPCLIDTTTPPTSDQIDEARLVLIGAIKRWVEAGSGSVSRQTAGPFGMEIDTRQKSSGFNLWPSEIEQLQAICSNGTDKPAGAFSIGLSGSGDRHAPWCAINMGANYCDCGAIYAGYPLWSDPNGVAP